MLLLNSPKTCQTATTKRRDKLPLTARHVGGRMANFQLNLMFPRISTEVRIICINLITHSLRYDPPMGRDERSRRPDLTAMA